MLLEPLVPMTQSLLSGPKQVFSLVCPLKADWAITMNIPGVTSTMNAPWRVSRVKYLGEGCGQVLRGILTYMIKCYVEWDRKQGGLVGAKVLHLRSFPEPTNVRGSQPLAAFPTSTPASLSPVNSGHTGFLPVPLTCCLRRRCFLCLDYIFPNYLCWAPSSYLSLSLKITSFPLPSSPLPAIFLHFILFPLQDII